MIIFISGKNFYQTTMKLEEIKSDFLSKNNGSGLHNVSAEDVSLSEIQSALMSRDLFSNGETMVVLKSLESNKYLQEKLLETFDEMSSSDSTLVIYSPTLDRRSAIFKQLKKAAVFHDFPELDERQLIDWARSYLEANSKNISLVDARFLVNRVNLDQLSLKNELDKLIYSGRDIDSDLIIELVEESFSDTVFKLLDLLFSNNLDQAVKEYRNLISNKVDPHFILSMVIWQLHILAVVFFNLTRSNGEVSKDYKISPFVVGKTRSIAQKLSRSDLTEIINLAAQIDLDSKTQAAFNIEAATELLIIKIARNKKPATSQGAGSRRYAK